MKRLTATIAVASCVTVAFVLTRFSSEVIPTGFLGRPLVAAVVVGVVVGFLSMTAGRFSPVLAAVGAVVVMEANLWTLALYLAVVGAAGFAEHRGWTFDLEQPTLAAAGIFAIAALIGAVPHISLGSPAHASESADSPIYLIMLDGYSRVDAMQYLGVDIEPFVEAMEARGFTYYPGARSASYHTHRVLAGMLTGEEGGEWGSVAERRAIRDSLRLPDGFVSVAPGVSHVTIDARDIGPGGVNNFEFDLLRRSVFAYVPWFGERMLDAWRGRIDGSLDIIASTHHDQVFAHLMTPHTPYLYGPDGPLGLPGCWPECHVFAALHRDHPGLAPTVEWLNQRLLETVDAILARRPDAQIVLFGDHGLRFTGDGSRDGVYQPLLLARTTCPLPSQTERIVAALSC